MSAPASLARRFTRQPLAIYLRRPGDPMPAPNGDELGRAHYDVRVPKGFEGGGRFRKLSDRLISLLNDWAKGEGDDDPLDQFSRDQLRRVAKELADKALASGDHERAARLTPRRGASSDEIKLALYKDVRAHVRGQRDAKAEAPGRAKFTLQGGPTRDAETATTAGALKPGDKILVHQDRIGVWSPARPRQMGTPITVRRVEHNPGRISTERTIWGVDEAGNEVIVTGSPLARVKGSDNGLHSHDDVRLLGSSGSDLRGVDVAVYRDPQGKPALYRENDAGQRGRLVKKFDSLDDMAQWADDSGEPHVADWARAEAGRAKSPALDMHTPAEAAKLSPGLDMTVPESRDVINAEARRRVETVLDDVDEMLAGDGSDAALLNRLEGRRKLGAPASVVDELEAAVRQDEVENAIRQAFRDLHGRTDLPKSDLSVGNPQAGMPFTNLQDAMRRGGHVSIADIRDHLGEKYNRHDVDAALIRMSREDGVYVSPQSAQNVLMQRDRDAALRFGEQDYHWIQIDDPSPRRDRVRQVSADIRGRLGEPSAPSPAPAKKAPGRAPRTAKSATDLASARRDLADRLANEHSGPDEGVLSRDLWASEGDPAKLRRLADGYDATATEYETQAAEGNADQAARLTAAAAERRRQAAVLRAAADESDRLAAPSPAPAKKAPGRFEGMSATEIEAALNADPSMNPTALRRLAEENGVALPKSTQTQSALRRRIAERLGSPAPGRAARIDPAGTVRAEGYSRGANSQLRVVSDGKGGFVGQRLYHSNDGSTEWRDDPSLGTGSTPKDITSRFPSGGWSMVAPPKSTEAPGRAAAKVAKPAAVVDQATFDTSSLDGLTIRQKRARLKAMGFSPERIDEIAPTAAMAKKAAGGGLNPRMPSREGLPDPDAREAAAAIVAGTPSDSEVAARLKPYNMRQQRAIAATLRITIPATNNGERWTAASLAQHIAKFVIQGRDKGAIRSASFDAEDLVRAEELEFDGEPEDDDEEDEPVDEMDLALAHYTEDVERAAGHDVTPGHDELHHYWTRGKGLKLWAGSPKPWTTLVAHLTKYVGPEKAKIYASRWFIEVFGFAAGSDLNRVTHGKPPRGHRVGPG